MNNYKKLRKEVLDANLRLPGEDLVKLTWGNVSEISSDRSYFAIKPSGVDYKKLRAKDIVIISMTNGKKISGSLEPSSDVESHYYIYKNFKDVKGITHTHSLWATTFAQAGKNVDIFGTTHADSFIDKIYCTRDLTQEEIEGNYELNTAKVIKETYENQKINILDNPAILVKEHGLFTFGKDANDSVNNAIIAEFVSKLTFNTLKFKNNEMNQFLLKKHHDRKHGPNAYYGQKGKK